MGEDLICTPCYTQLPLTDFLDNPFDNEMCKVFWKRIHCFQKAYALTYHLAHSGSANLIYQLKYFNKPYLGYSLGLLMGRMMKANDFFDGIDCILPVPLAPKREKKRGYNQSNMIAQGLHEVSGLPIVKNAVRRVSFDASQTKKDRLERENNVEKVFERIDSERVKGKHLLIVDDVVTTGATVCALSKVLENVEGVRISVASIAYASEWRFIKK